jgi:hypothetical protein
MTGRKPGAETGKLSQNVIDALATLWHGRESDPLTFMQIHKWLVKRGIVKSEKQKASTVRILEKAKKQELVKHEGNQYFIDVVPEEFRVFDYLQRLRNKAKTSRFTIGSTFCTTCELYLLGMPESALKYPDIENMLQVLGVRISKLYQAFRVLAEEAKRRETLPNTNHYIPYDAARELLLELIPYYLANNAGSSGNGFAIEDLNKLIPKMIEALPEEVEPQNPTRKNIILKHFKVLNELIKLQNEEKFSSPEEEPKDFALVMAPPEGWVDEDEQDRRWIKQELEEYADKSPLYIASILLMFKKENVDNVLYIYGRKLLEAKKLNETKKLYEKMHASDCVASLIHDFEYYDDKDKAEAMKIIQDLTQKHGRKSIIVYLAFSRSSTCWFLPTPEKEKLLQQFFPYHSEQEIHDWLTEGAELHKPLAEEKWKHLMKSFENLKSDET